MHFHRPFNMKSPYNAGYSLLVFASQAATACIIPLVGFVFGGTDARTYWPLILVFEIVRGGFFAAAFLYIARTAVLPRRYVIGFNLLASSAQCGLALLFYALPIDWLAVNNGEKSLSLLEIWIQSPLVWWGMGATFLVAHAALIQRYRTA